MADLTVVRDDLSEFGWRGQAALVRDEATGQHYVVSTSAPAPWAPDFIETLVWESSPEGDAIEDPLHHIAGGRDMDRDEAMADLSARIDDDVLITAEQAQEYAQLKFDEQGEDFVTWLTAGGGALV